MDGEPSGRAVDDDRHLRRSFEVARRAREAGNHPFGAVLVGPDGAVLMEQGNDVAAGRDRTAHAERLLMSRASQAYPPGVLARCTMYTSAEPCAMCAGAAYWAGLGRVVYGLGERELRAVTGDHPDNPTLDLPCRTVFAAGQRSVTVVGPSLVDEAAALHRGIWDRP